jgi:hypothetical protein
MINVIPLTIESLVAMLLLLTILYCVRLNGQLKRLKADKSAMQATVADLVTATGTAERAIAGLKATVHEAERTLGERLKAAEYFSEDMHRSAEAGADVLHRLTQIARARPWLLGVDPLPDARPPAPDPQAIAAAARAVAERAHSRLKVNAA